MLFVLLAAVNAVVCYCILDRATQLENFSFVLVSLVIVHVQLYVSFSAHLKEYIEL